MIAVRWLGLAALALAACMHTGQGGAAEPATPSAKLSLSCPVGEATVRIDERYLGEVRELRGGVRLAVGPHRLELRAEGYVTRYAELTIVDGQDQTFACDLREELPSP